MAERDREAPVRCCSYHTVQRWFPVLRWLPQYSLGWLQLDLLAGVTVGLTVVPQALAYAEVAGLPVQYGLYSSFMGCFVYCLLGTAKDVTLGPTAIMSLLVSSYAFHDPAYAILLTFLSGCIQLAMGLLHLGFLLDFVSCPVIKGFTSAASVTISFNQVKNILGLHNVPRQFFLQVYHTFQRIGETRAGDALLGLVCLAVLVGLRAMKGHIPRIHRVELLSVRISRLIVWATATARNALVVLFAGLVAYSFQVMGSQPFTLTGETPRGLPPFQLPPFSKAEANSTVPFSEMVQDLGAGLAVVPLMGLLETVAIAKAFASQNNYRIDPNQELLAMGLTNLLGSFVSSYPVTGSFGRTAVNAQTGVCTPAGGLITGLDLVPLCVTFLLCFWEVQYGIVAGILVSGVLLLYTIARPRIKLSEHGVLLMQPASGLHFPAVESLRDAMHRWALAVSPPRCVILDCTHVSSLDYTVVMGLADLLREFQKRGVTLTFSGLQGHVLQVLLSADLEGFQHFPSVEEAEKGHSAELDGRCRVLLHGASGNMLPESGLIQ
ncbi:sodium-independent sulfate anion transporter isoform X2 [Malaclemys terrapin pileata]|uniref:sodium-independent sulfate anion transporter isoform X2 n=1 Tax=Malaclemys terrapin pileata TaxID=2991368 RepID=UPI0023A8E879|nr:sodium-independent sulfate anion transporter isoform X2 [Malaclemys terrapin pileata]